MFKFLVAFFERIFGFFKGMFLFLRDLFLGKRTTQISADKGSDQSPDEETKVTISDKGLISLNGKELSEFSSNTLKGAYVFSSGRHNWQDKNALYYAIINKMRYSNFGAEYMASIISLRSMINILFSKKIREGEVLPSKLLNVSNDMSNKEIILNKTYLIEALGDVYLFCNSDKVSEQKKMKEIEKIKLASDINLLFNGRDNIDILDFLISSKDCGDLLEAYVTEKSHDLLESSIHLNNLRKLIKRCCELNKNELGRKVLENLKEDCGVCLYKGFIIEEREYSLDEEPFKILDGVFNECYKILKEENGEAHQAVIASEASSATNAFGMRSISSSDKQADPSITEEPDSGNPGPSDP